MTLRAPLFTKIQRPSHWTAINSQSSVWSNPLVSLAAATPEPFRPKDFPYPRRRAHTSWLFDQAPRNLALLSTPVTPPTIPLRFDNPVLKRHVSLLYGEPTRNIALLTSTAYPTIYAELSPLIEDGDEADLPTVTNLGTGIGYAPNGMPSTVAGADEYVSGITIQRNATGDWHPMASPPGFKYWINGRLRPLTGIGAARADAIAAWEGIGYTIVETVDASGVGTPGTVFSQTFNGVEVGAYDLLPISGTVTLAISIEVIPQFTFVPRFIYISHRNRNSNL